MLEPTNIVNPKPKSQPFNTKITTLDSLFEINRTIGHNPIILIAKAQSKLVNSNLKWSQP